MREARAEPTRTQNHAHRTTHTTHAQIQATDARSYARTAIMPARTDDADPVRAQNPWPGPCAPVEITRTDPMPTRTDTTHTRVARMHARVLKAHNLGKKIACVRAICAWTGSVRASVHGVFLCMRTWDLYAYERGCACMSGINICACVHSVCVCAGSVCGFCTCVCVL